MHIYNLSDRSFGNGYTERYKQYRYSHLVWFLSRLKYSVICNYDASILLPTTYRACRRAGFHCPGVQIKIWSTTMVYKMVTCSIAGIFVSLYGKGASD